MDKLLGIAATVVVVLAIVFVMLGFLRLMLDSWQYVGLLVTAGAASYYLYFKAK